MDVDVMEAINKKAVELLSSIQRKMETLPETKIILVGKIGPRGDGYFPDKSQLMSSKEAENYHSQQISWLAATEVDMVNKINLSTINPPLEFILTNTVYFSYTVFICIF